MPLTVHCLPVADRVVRSIMGPLESRGYREACRCKSGPGNWQRRPGSLMDVQRVSGSTEFPDKPSRKERAQPRRSQRATNPAPSAQAYDPPDLDLPQVIEPRFTYSMRRDRTLADRLRPHRPAPQPQRYRPLPRPGVAPGPAPQPGPARRIGVRRARCAERRPPPQDVPHLILDGHQWHPTVPAHGESHSRGARGSQVRPEAHRKMTSSAGQASPIFRLGRYWGGGGGGGGGASVRRCCGTAPGIWFPFAYMHC
jgi:hypothetical protein